ncbi:LPXTG cell wall anchor domain-containing protein [Kitasatospora sp. NPDC059722]|uniref:LPXTG cell wall anchor domain-containing protein n=1 Tax=Kitasatospora sp. NPDC059722 TaxID=3346925 RepID=UPI003677DFAD
MKHVRRAAAVTGGAVAVLALAGTVPAYAWKPSDATLTVGCRPDGGHVELVLGNDYKSAGDYTLGLIGGTEEYHGTIDGHGTAKVMVSYSGHGDQWRYTLADTHVDKKIADVPLCPSGTPTPTVPSTPAVPATPTATPTQPATHTPAPTSSRTATPTPSGTPSAAAVLPSSTPSASASAAPALAQTGGGGNTTLAVAGAATLAAGAGLIVAGRKVAARRKA